MLTSIASSLGIGSGIDTRTLVNELAANARQLREGQIARKESGNGARISAVAQLKAGLSALATDYADAAPGTANADLKKLITNFVSEFNILRQALTDDMRAGTPTVSPGALSGDSSGRALGYALGRLSQTALTATGTYRSLSDVGIGLTRSGQLMLDSTKFTAALADKPDEVAAMLTGTSGLSKTLNDLQAAMNAADGPLATASARYERIAKSIAKERSGMEDGNTKLVERLTRSFGGMDRQIAQLNAVKSYIEQQVAAWNASK